MKKTIKRTKYPLSIKFLDNGLKKSNSKYQSQELFKTRNGKWFFKVRGQWVFDVIKKTKGLYRKEAVGNMFAYVWLKHNSFEIEAQTFLPEINKAQLYEDYLKQRQKGL